MTAYLALILMINGVQVDLPAPAYLIGDYAFVPARAVFEKLGRQVKWDGATQALTVSGKGCPSYVLTVGKTEATLAGGLLDSRPLVLPAAPRIVGGLLYVPARAVALITGARLTWEEKNLTVRLDGAPDGTPTPTTVGEILGNPPAFAGRLVQVRGEYTGWKVDPLGVATSQGPPVTRSDWGLRDAGGSIYCTGSTQFDPLGDLGRRLEVTGVVALADAGFPYLQVTGAAPLAGLAGVTCYLTTDRLSYRPGETAHLSMEVANPGPEAVLLKFSSAQKYDFEVREAGGQVVWAWSRDKVFAQMLTERLLPPGEKYTITEAWTLPADLAPGRYQVRGWLNREVSAYPQAISVAKD